MQPVRNPTTKPAVRAISPMKRGGNPRYAKPFPTIAYPSSTTDSRTRYWSLKLIGFEVLEM
jgi:hypothetical protein